MERMKEGRKEGGRKWRRWRGKKTISIKTQSPTMFFKEELASVLWDASSRNVALRKYWSFLKVMYFFRGNNHQFLEYMSVKPEIPIPALCKIFYTGNHSHGSLKEQWACSGCTWLWLNAARVIRPSVPQFLSALKWTCRASSHHGWVML